MTPSEPRRPRTAEIMRAAALVWRRNWKYAFFITGLFVLPPLVINLFVPDRYVLAMMTMQDNMLAMMEAGAGTDLLQGLPYMADAMVYSLITLGLSALFMPMAAGAYTYVAVQGVQNKPVTMAGILEASLLRFWKYLLTTALLLIGCALTAWLLFIPALIFSVYFAFYANAVALTGRSGFGALRISYEAVRGRWFAALGFLLVMGIMSYFGQTMVSFLIVMTGLDQIPYLGIFLVAAGEAVLAVFPIAQALWFLDRLNRLTVSAQGAVPAGEEGSGSDPGADAE